MVLYIYKYWFKMLKRWKLSPLIKARASSTNCTMSNLTCSRHTTYLHTIYVKSREIHILSTIQILKVGCILIFTFFFLTVLLKTFRLGSCHVTFHSSWTVQSFKTVKYFDHSSFSLCFNWDTLRFRIAHWSVENVNPDMTQNLMLLGISVSPKKKGQ
jgi:hypothetical protein